MPRNGNGTMSGVDSISAEDDLEAEPVQNQFDDIYSEITNSLAKDGQTIMTGQLKAANGSAAAPAYTFGSDLNTGFYRADADTIGIAVGGVSVATIDDGGISYFPAGTAMLFVQTAAPTGWTKSTTHNDKALRIVSGTASSGGTTAFTSVFAARTIAEDNLPAHTHGLGTLATASGGSHTHTVSGGIRGGTGNDQSNGASGQIVPSGNSVIVIDSGGAHTHTFTGALANTGSGTALDFAVQYIDVIYATKDA